jgi:hypothetical protein
MTVGNPFIFFQWIGAANEAARNLASEHLNHALFELFTLLPADANIHVFAHSHGGNVLGHALADLPERINTVSLLGTPPRVNGANWAESIRKVGTIYNYYSLKDHIQNYWANKANNEPGLAGFETREDSKGCFKPQGEGNVINYDFTSLTDTSFTGATAHKQIHSLEVVGFLEVPAGTNPVSIANTAFLSAPAQRRCALPPVPAPAPVPVPAPGLGLGPVPGDAAAPLAFKKVASIMAHKKGVNSEACGDETEDIFDNCDEEEIYEGVVETDGEPIEGFFSEVEVEESQDESVGNDGDEGFAAALLAAEDVAKAASPSTLFKAKSALISKKLRHKHRHPQHKEERKAEN